MSQAFRAECTITLDGVDLDLQFLSYNIRALQGLTGKTPPEFFARFEGMGVDEVSTASRLCDFEYVIALIQAGLAKHPKFKRVRQEDLTERLCTLVDNEAAKQKVPSFTVIGQCMVNIFPALMAALAGPQVEKPGEPNQGNEPSEVPESKTEVSAGVV